MKEIILKVWVLTFLLFVIVASAKSQPPPPPATHGLSSNQPSGGGSGAPIGDGMFLLIALSAAYGTKKAYTAKHKETEDES